MDPIEQRVRDSLRARAEGAEPTPHLYRGVQARIARRRRQKLLAWVPASAAALGVAVAIPFLLTSGGPDVPRIEDYATPPRTSEATPDRAVIYDGAGGLEILDLRDGTVTDSGVQTPPQGALSGLAVPAGDRGDDPAWVALETLPGTEPTWNIFRPGVSEVSAGFPGVIGDGGMAVSDDGGWVAYLGTPEEADGYVLTVASTVMDGEMEIHTVANVSEDARVLDWAGPIDATSGTGSEILVATANGTVTSFEVDWTDGVPTVVSRENVAMDAGPVLAASLDHVRSEDRAWSRYQLEQRGDERHVRFVEAMTLEPRGELDVTSLVGDADPADLWLDAWGDATLLGDGTSVWLLRHDGEGDFATPVALPEGTVRAALIGKDVPAGPADEDPEPDGGIDDDGDIDDDGGLDDGGVDDDGISEDGPADGPGTLGDGLIVADQSTVWVVRPDGLRDELVTFPAEGESTVVAVAVRPGSTADDLTVAITTRAEGTFDVRWLRVVDGQVDTSIDPVGTEFPAPPIEGAGGFPFAAPDLQDGGAPAAAWSPDGDLLAVVARPSAGGSAELRTIGWTDDGPNQDPNLAATFELDTDRPLTLRQWTWIDDAAGTTRDGQLILIDEAAREAFTLRLDRQGDGAPAMPNQNPLQRVPESGVRDLADADGDGTFDTALRTVGGPWPMLEIRTFEGGEETITGVEIDTGGSGSGGLLAAWDQVLLVVIDPAQPLLVDRVTGDVAPARLGVDVVSADPIR